MNVQYTPEALAGLEALPASEPAIIRAVNDELDLFEAEPGLTRWKRRGFGGVSPRTYGFDIHAPRGELLVLWQQTTASMITVVYVGEPI